MSAEEDVQLALALIQASIAHLGPTETTLVGYKNFARVGETSRGQKFLRNNNFVDTAVRIGTTVKPQYRDLAGLKKAVEEKYNTTLQRAPFTLLTGYKQRRPRVRDSEHVTPTRARDSEHVTPTRARARQPRVVQVSSESASDSESRDSDSDDSSEYGNTDVRDSEDSDSMTPVTRRVASPHVPVSRARDRAPSHSQFALHEQRLVEGFQADKAAHHDIMMTIKIFGATLPVPKDTLVFQPSREFMDLSPES